MKGYISELAPFIIDFIKFKNSLGIQYTTGSVYLKQLDLYNFEHKNLNVPDRETVENWAIIQESKSITGDRSWVSPIREFGRYMQSIGYENAYVLDDRFIIQRYHAEVYLMSESEIQQFFVECDCFVLNHTGKGRPYVLPALFRFLYCCGARCGEARKLTCENVHLDNGYLDILQSKAHRDRRLFLSEELVEYLRNYDKAISACFPKREYFFPGEGGGIFSSSSLSNNFKNIWLSAGLKRDGTVKSRAYDFRHHFACANIMKWSAEGKNIHAMLPYLMRYMGHTSLESTYYYIHLIPDFFKPYRNLTASSENLIPEVEFYEV